MAERELLEVDGIDAELFVGSWKPAVDHALQELWNLSATTGALTQHYEASTLLALRHASYALRSRGQNVDEDEVERLKSALLYLLDDVRGAQELEPDVRGFMERHVVAMLSALVLLPVAGRTAFEAAVAETLGDAAIRKAEGKEGPDPSTPVGEKFSRVMTRAGEFIRFSNGAIDLGAKVVEGLQALGA